ATLKEAGARNYSIFRVGTDLFGYLEVDDFDRFRSVVDGSEANARWQMDMAHLIDPMTDPETGFHQRLEEVFHLDWSAERTCTRRGDRRPRGGRPCRRRRTLPSPANGITIGWMVAATARAPGDQIVALLFTDIEGSTRLARRLGPAWEETLERHRAIARAAFAHHGAGEVATEGDSFFVVFQDPLDAVHAAVELQVNLDLVEWPAGARVRIRIGIHAGAVTASDGEYHGVEVHRA